MLDSLKDNLRTKLSSKLTAAIFISFLVLFTLYNLFFAYRFYNLINNNTKSTLARQCSALSSQIDNYLLAKSDILGSVAENSDVVDFLTSNAGGDRSEFTVSDLGELLDFYSGIDSDISNVWIIADSGLYAASDDSEYTGSYKDCRWYSAIVSRNDPDYVWYSQDCSADGDSSVQLVTCISENGNILGYAGIDIPISSIYRIVSRISFENDSYPIILSEDGDIIYRPERFSEDNLGEIIAEAMTGVERYTTFKDEDSTRYAYYTSSILSGWKTIFATGGHSYYYDYRNFFTIQAAIYVVVCGVMFLIFRIFVRRSLGDLKPILKAIDMIESGNYSTKINSSSNNELKRIADVIDEFSEALTEKNSVIADYAGNDQLTGLYNKDKTLLVMNEHIASAAENRTKLALVFIDLDNFKWVNDTMGHKFGDEALKAFSSQLKALIGQKGTCGRFGGDEFVIILPFDSDYSEVSPLIERINKASTIPLNIMGEDIYIKHSIGVAIYPDDDSDGANLLRNADIAANKAKEHGKDRMEFYNFDQHSSVSSKTSISQKLNSALDNGELYLNFQPIVSTKSGRIYGFESLVRWRSNELGQLPPNEFISIAEQTGMIIPIGSWIFESACRFTKKLVAEGYTDIVMSINVSPQQLKQQGFVDYVKSVLEITGVPTKNIQVEVTESLLIDGIETANEILKEIRAMGMRVALDDFGTGYCSFSYLKELPITSIKIDKAFVNEIVSSKRDFNIIGSIIQLVRNLDIKTIAEGVETQEQYNTLLSMNCDYIQGYVVGKPLDEDSAVEFIKNNLSAK